MNQTRTRSAIGAAPRRPVVSVRPGLSPRYVAPMLGSVGRSPSVISRVQPTAYLLGSGYYLQPKSNWAVKAALGGGLDAAVKTGLGSVGASWLTQGVVLALASTFIDRMIRGPETEADKAEAELKTQEAVRKLSDPFEGASLVGHNRIVDLSSVRGSLRGTPFQPTTALGRLHLSSAAATQGINTAAVITSTAIKSGSSLASSGTWLAAAGGPIGIGVAGATVALAYLFTRQRPARKVATTEIVNEVEPLLQQNLASYTAGPRTPESQAQALANFNAGWDFVKTYCGDPNMGKPGEWCIDDRKRGGKWDWFARYYDPIATDVQPQQIAAQRVATGTTGNGTDVQTMVDPQTGQVVQIIPGQGESGNMLLLLVAGGVALYMMAS